MASVPWTASPMVPPVFFFPPLVSRILSHSASVTCSRLFMSAYSYSKNTAADDMVFPIDAALANLSFVILIQNINYEDVVGF